MRLKLISWNINGIRAAERKGFLEWLASSNADLVALQETKAHPDQLSTQLLHPPGYQSHWNSAVKKGYSGTVTYSRLTPFQVNYGMNDLRFDSEGRVLVHEFEPFVFFNIYFPNGGRGPEWVAHKLAFYRRFLEVSQDYVRTGKPLIATGDFNTAFAEIDIARPKENVSNSGFMPEERLALGELFEAGFIDTFRHLHPDTIKYTWWDLVSRARERNVGWRLDYFLITPELKPKLLSADIHDEIMGSDHCPISIELEI